MQNQVNKLILVSMVVLMVLLQNGCKRLPGDPETFQNIYPDVHEESKSGEEVNETVDKKAIALDYVNDDESKFKVFILMGQSNMAGYAQEEDFPDQYLEADDDLLIFDGTKWIPLVPVGEHNGPEIGFLAEMKVLHPEFQYGVIKIALDGAPITAFLPEDNPRYELPAQRVELNKELQEYIVNAGKVSSMDIEAILWKQGAADAAIKKNADNYREMLTTIIEGIRTNVSMEDLPLFLATYFDMSYVDSFDQAALDATFDDLPYAYDIIKAHNEASDYISNTTIIHHGLLPTITDGAHFNTEGQLELGKMFAKSVSEVLYD